MDIGEAKEIRTVAASVKAEVGVGEADGGAAAVEDPLLGAGAVAVVAEYTSERETTRGRRATYISTGVPLACTLPWTSRHFAVLPFG